MVTLSENEQKELEKIQAFKWEKIYIDYELSRPNIYTIHCVYIERAETIDKCIAPVLMNWTQEEMKKAK